MLVVIRLWILLSALLVAAGWILSGFHQLNRVGYGIFFALVGVSSPWWRKQIQWPGWKAMAFASRKFFRRFKRPAPFLFLILALMALVGGSLYLHTNGDSSGYRIPRVWHWLDHGRWHWIHTADARMNIVASGFEWICAPVMLFTGTDRFIFLLNWVSYLMLPGLVFSMFTRLQVSPRVAWWWMWFLSAGWCYAVQASSDANDSFAAVYALAAVDLALRAQKSRSVTDLWLSVLAAALAIGVKQSNIPLVLLWLLAAGPAWRLAWTRPFATMLVAAAALLVSALPVTLSNVIHAGNWQGMTNGTTKSIWSAGSPFWKLVGNLYSVPVQNLLPPIFPVANGWNGMIARFLQTPFGAHFSSFEQFGHLNAGISEASAGIGLGLSIFTITTWVAARVGRVASAMTDAKRFPDYFWLLRMMPWLVLLIFMVEICSFADARLLSSYYAFLFPSLLAGTRQDELVRRLWWQRLGLLFMLLTGLVLVISRERPLFPALTVISRFQTADPQSKTLSRLWVAYAWPASVERRRNFIQEILPLDEKVVGYATWNGGDEPGLWVPFGARHVERVLVDDPPQQLQEWGIRYVLLDGEMLVAEHLAVEQWLLRYDASVVKQLEYLQDPYRPPGHLYFVRLNRPDERPNQTAPP